MGTDFNHKYINSNVYGLDYNFDLIDNKSLFLVVKQLHQMIVLKKAKGLI